LAAHSGCPPLNFKPNGCPSVIQFAGTSAKPPIAIEKAEMCGDRESTIQLCLVALALRQLDQQEKQRSGTASPDRVKW
jgi:hypothetical protein